MAHNYTISKEENDITIKVNGKFDFAFGTQPEIQDLVSSARYKKFVYSFDLRDCTYIDSSALGLLLIFRERAEKVTIDNVNSKLFETLKITNFHKLFVITTI